MKKRTILALAFLVVIGGFVAWKLTRPDPHVKKGTAPKGVPTWPFTPASGKPAPEVDELELHEAGKDAIVLKKGPEGWRVVKPLEDRADAKAVATAITALSELKLKDVIAESPDSYEKVGVADGQVTRVTARFGGKDLATILVGKTTNVRLPDDPKVYATAGLKRVAFVKDLKLWRDREIVRFEKDQLDTIEIAYADGGKITMKRIAPPAAPAGEKDEHGHEKPKTSAPDRYEVVEGKELIGGPLDEQVTTAVATSLMRLDALDFPATPAEGAAKMASPRATVTVKLLDGSAKRIVVGAIEGEDAWLRSGEDRVFKVRKVTAENLSKPPLQWRDKVLLKIPSTDIASVEVVKGTERMVMTRSPSPEGEWKVTTPADAPEIDAGKLNMLAGAFQAFRANSIVPAPIPTETGFTRPTAVVTVTRKDGGKAVITVGANKDKSYFVRVAGRDEVFSIGDMLVNRIMKTAADLKKSAAGPQSAPGGAHMPGGMMAPPPRPPGM